jgi:hypothetical protein
MAFIKTFFIQIFCKHEWGQYSYNYVRCKVCKKVKYNPGLASHLIFEFTAKMMSAGHWTKEEAVGVITKSSKLKHRRTK